MSRFTFPGNLAAVDYSAFLSQHDLVYLAPAPDGIDGLPVGNGDLGAMVWTPSDHLHLQINKTDLWDDGPDGPFGSWGDAEEESNTMLRSAGALSLGHGLPIFDRLYLTDFAARLRLAEAEVEIRAASPFAKMSAEVFVSKSAGVLVVHYQDWTEEKLPRRIELSRWGTRSLPHWYQKVLRAVPLSLTATQAGCDAEHVWIRQPLRDMHFAVVARLDGPARPHRLHNRAAAFVSEPATEFEGTVCVAVVNSEEADDPLAAAMQRVDAAATQGHTALRQEHQRWWGGFWQASFVDLPPEQDYVENLWYLNSYHLASCCQGRYPPNHIYALWAWNRDVFPWIHYYHWNDQLHTWPVHASGHAELALPYYRYRRAMLEHAMEDARQAHNIEGALYTDVANRKGYQAAAEGILSHNLTPGPQIAADFWRHWQYTRDEGFLKEYAYPVIREVARFYTGVLKRREDGCYTV
ncbi:MAG: glycoside hydrolase N-terminal domain-containing protein, partial [Anaerolineae bacterium]|nr:glycoside hydrolase N-terminal domain-containing protein [Anaerolineae bacterium]